MGDVDRTFFPQSFLATFLDFHPISIILSCEIYAVVNGILEMNIYFVDAMPIQVAYGCTWILCGADAPLFTLRWISSVLTQSQLVLQRSTSHHKLGPERELKFFVTFH